jgi:hypothetical protein
VILGPKAANARVHIPNRDCEHHSPPKEISYINSVSIHRDPQNDWDTNDTHDPNSALGNIPSPVPFRSIL